MKKRLATLYQMGLGVPTDFTLAASLWTDATRQRHILALRSIGLVYHIGRGAEPNHILAYACLNATVAQGDSDSAHTRDSAFSKLKAEQKKEAKVLAERYLRDYVKPFITPNNE